MSEDKQKKLGCLSIIGLAIIITIIVNIFKGGDYKVIKNENGIVVAEAELKYDDIELTTVQIAEIIWNISKKYNEVDKIEVTVILVGYDFYGKESKDRLNPYTLDKEEIAETNKYELDNYKYQIGDELARVYLMQNGY